jgi:hypothetical protein
MTAQEVIAQEIFTNSDQWDLDDFGMQAAAEIVAKLEKAGYAIGPKQSFRPVGSG